MVLLTFDSRQFVFKAQSRNFLNLGLVWVISVVSICTNLKIAYANPVVFVNNNVVLI